MQQAFAKQLKTIKLENTQIRFQVHAYMNHARSAASETRRTGSQHERILRIERIPEAAPARSGGAPAPTRTYSRSRTGEERWSARASANVFYVLNVFSGAVSRPSAKRPR
jgi:hypothetical protein